MIGKAQSCLEEEKHKIAKSAQRSLYRIKHNANNLINQGGIGEGYGYCESFLEAFVNCNPGSISAFEKLPNTHIFRR